MQTCAICCNPIKCDSDGFKTPCNHFMHNSCLTHWLLLKNSCPICRYNIYGIHCSEDNDDDNENLEDDDYNNIQNIEVNLINEIYTSKYDTILEAIREILYSMTLNNEESENYIFTKKWFYDEIYDTYNLRLNTRNEIINIYLSCDLFDTTIFADIVFNTIYKNISKYLNNSLKNNLFISNYSQKKLPTRINCY